MDQLQVVMFTGVWGKGSDLCLSYCANIQPQKHSVADENRKRNLATAKHCAERSSVT